MQIGHERRIRIARLAIGRGPAGIHHFIAVIAAGPRVHLEHGGLLTHQHGHGARPELGSPYDKSVVIVSLPSTTMARAMSVATTSALAPGEVWERMKLTAI